MFSYQCMKILLLPYTCQHRPSLLTVFFNIYLLAWFKYVNVHFKFQQGRNFKIWHHVYIFPKFKNKKTSVLLAYLLVSDRNWAPKNWCFWIMVLEKTLESPLDCKDIQPVHPKGDQSWVFIGRTDAEAETLTLWPPHAKSWLIGKDPDAGMDWGQEEKGTTEDEMVGWHYQLDGHGFE